MEPNSDENPIQTIMDAFDQAAAKGHEEKKEFI